MIEKFKGGTAQPNLGAKDLQQFELPLPPIDRQREVAQRLEQITVEVKRLEEIYRRKLDVSRELRQSLLYKAFSGELTSAKDIAA